MAQFPFNLNNKIKVKLTEAGYVRYTNQVDAYNDAQRREDAVYRKAYDFPIDKEGYSTWQVWAFMKHFGGIDTGLCKEQLYDCHVILEDET